MTCNCFVLHFDNLIKINLYLERMLSLPGNIFHGQVSSVIRFEDVIIYFPSLWQISGGYIAINSILH